ncbi:hypothetical protein [Roseibium aggregatum]|uniref:Uncharacterized protein n=1 Tax=Roseibium aggregatum TaxID=187304 RepID=A0A0M6Y8H3_9HYPH|nr:hypothetical protein [Roseibium aggregatum]CTQ45709.1 hypothetical protein LAL4801_04164 [Roseibium aggregatum]
MAYEIVEQKAWSNGKTTVALTQVFDPTGFEIVSQGFRIKKDGKTLYPGYKPFPTREAAEEKLKEIA